MHVDAMSAPRPLADMATHARRTHDAGFDGLVLTEGGRSAFPAAAAAALGAAELHLVDRDRRCLRPQPDGRRPGGVGAGRRRLADGSGSASAPRSALTSCAATAPSSSTPVHASPDYVESGEGMLRRLPRRNARSPRAVLRADVHQPAVEPGTDRTRRPPRSTSPPSTRGCCAWLGAVADGVHIHPPR